jgi:hypothetical protein
VRSSLAALPAFDGTSITIVGARPRVASMSSVTCSMEFGTTGDPCRVAGQYLGVGPDDQLHVVGIAYSRRQCRIVAPWGRRRHGQMTEIQPSARRAMRSKPAGV